MKIRILTLISVVFFAALSGLQAQVSINSDGSAPDASAMLEVKSNTSGLLVPRMTTAERLTLGAIAVAGLVVYDTDLNAFYYYNGSAWQVGSVGNLWTRNGINTYLTNMGDNVGIGTTNPGYDFDVFPSSGSSFMRNKSTDSFAGYILDKGGNSENGYLLFRNLGVTQWYVGMIGNNNFAISKDFNSPDGIFYINGDGDIGMGTVAPARTLEVRGPWQTARISSTSSGSTLEFVSTTEDDWAVTTWVGNMALIWSDNDFTSKTDQFYFGTSAFWPWTDNSKTLGTSSKQWSTLYSIDGLFSGRAAVGTQSLLGAFHVHDPNSELATMYITPATTGSEDSSRIFFAEDHDGTFGMYWLYDGVQNQMELWGYSSGTDYGPHILVNRSNGYMALGSTFGTGYRLSVDGKIICTELRVNLVADWPDYVFRDDYKLMPLGHLRNFISENGHLPNVPAADKIEQSGLDVGETQKLLMQKIEELTLYILEQDEQIKELKQQMENGRK